MTQIVRVLPIDLCNLPVPEKPITICEEKLRSWHKNPIFEFEQLTAIMKDICPGLKGSSFNLLKKTFNKMSEKRRYIFLNKTSPFILRSAIGEGILPLKQITIIPQGLDCTIKVSQKYLLHLMAKAWLCITPKLKNGITFNNLFSDERDFTDMKISKLNSFINYFEGLRINKNGRSRKGCGFVHFSRKVLGKKNFIDWRKFEGKLFKIIIDKRSCVAPGPKERTIVCFADAQVGSAAFNSSNDQESNLCMAYPELAAVPFFFEPLADNEAMEIVGLEKFNTFDHTGICSYTDRSPMGFDPKYPIRQTTLLAIDALERWKSSDSQLHYVKTFIDREIIKAFIAFKQYEGATQGRIATGDLSRSRWRNDPMLKMLLQWIAASAAGRTIKFYTEDAMAFKDVKKLIPLIRKNGNTVASLYHLIMIYSNYVNTAREPKLMPIDRYLFALFRRRSSLEAKTSNL